MKITLAQEQQRMQRLLKGRVVKRVWRRRKKEFGIEFTDGTRLYVDWKPDQTFDFSVT